MSGMPLSRLARDFAAEINFHDWSDAPLRADRAGHQRSHDGARRVPDEHALSDKQTDTVRMNVMWVVAQVLAHHDPGFDVYRFAEACGVDTRTSAGRARSGVITAGLRNDDLGRPAGPVGQLFCHVCDRTIGGRYRGRVENQGPVRRGGVVHVSSGRWVWGPVPVHEQCRTAFVTPYDPPPGSPPLPVAAVHEVRWESVDAATATRDQHLQDLLPHPR